ncbi:hypothetical protein NP493_8709g00006 [Ridgeia piscesae]|uniref:Chitin-binding type-2 domain-containing protein n=1 Tax=Ridgeia piscesae TaxID=27915 RepID=A0AAD9IP59_RIDPI|nr:hypothetical protein NP493_8709g00006 [Ridgeia piscesae]
MNTLTFVVLALASVAVSAQWNPHHCGSSCDGLPDGQYPTVCKGCPHYYECRNGILTFKKCRGNSCYNPVLNRCQQYCPSGRHGISKCIGMPDGDYQHCNLCSIYTECKKGHIDVGICPFPLNWDDNVKKCVRYSSTCSRWFYQ